MDYADTECIIGQLDDSDSGSLHLDDITGTVAVPAPQLWSPNPQLRQYADSIDATTKPDTTSRTCPFSLGKFAYISKQALVIIPAMFFFAIGTGIYIPVFTEIMKMRVCQIVMNYTDEFCAVVGRDDQFRQANLAVQRTTTSYIMYATLGAAVPGVVFTFLMGSWSDRYGRKTPMAVPCFGYFCQSILLLFVAYFHLHPAYLVASAFLAAMFGGWTMFFMGYNSYVGDHTTEENRSAVLAIGAGTFGVGVSVGQLTGTALLKHRGFAAPFWLFSAMLFASFVYILLVADEHAKFKEKPAKGLEMSGSMKAGSFFKVKGIRDNWALLRQERTGNRRTYIYLLLGSYFLMIMCLENEFTILQLLVEFPPLSWTILQLGTFSSIQGVVSCMAISLMVPVFKKVFKMRDTAIGIVAGLSAIACVFLYAIAVKSWMLYLAVVVGVIRQLSFVAVQATLIHLVGETDVGKTMSVVGSVQAVGMIVGSLMFSNIFKATAHWWPGFTFAVQAFMLLAPLATFCLIDSTRA
ncbi:hypothetical protein RvY_02630 [Ramazzottius varieornatus]|uniref:Major facilitator superfamily (MFS) profile domain-containing protein n=1 Tax=Ramazzottius varieornatus TaxID=947166 RepID=A0A1D1UUX5_RAMVA|nr:hypothetical protein RvY_02630 [Ramazzottius varieornatus]